MMEALYLPMRWGGVSHHGDGFVILEETLENDRSRDYGGVRDDAPYVPNLTVVVPYDWGAVADIKQWLEDRSYSPDITLVTLMDGTGGSLAFEFSDKKDAALFKLFWG